MTSLQIDYWRLKETERTNKANEGLRGAEIAEMSRHNKATEALGWAQLGEAQRHNKQAEETNQYSANTARMHELSWKDIQDAMVAIHQDEVKVAQRRNELQSMDIELGFNKLDWEKEKWGPEYEARMRALDQEQQDINTRKSENARKWVSTAINEVLPTIQSVWDRRRMAKQFDLFG